MLDPTTCGTRGAASCWIQQLGCLRQCPCDVIYHLLPQGEVEAKDRVINMVNKMDEEGFGNCTNTGACEVECPKGISLDNISRMNREFLNDNFKK